MLEQIFIPVGLLYFLFSGALFLFGANFIYLSFLSWHHSHKREARQRTLADWPRVTVQLPIYNELYVAERVIRAASELDYPRGRLDIQVLDDSTDETEALVQDVVHQLQSQGVSITHVRRKTRTGYKAGALQVGLERANGEYIAIFDADFVPEPDFLKRTLPAIALEPQVAFVQTRWGHLNPDYSWITYLQSLAIDAHFMVEQFARSQAGYWFNFNGTAGIWRKEALLDVGGWRADTLTEDLDLSYRAYLQGWKGRYVRDIEVRAELPVNFSAFRRQQHRWARGSLECALKLIPRVWDAPISLSRKIQATLHLTGYTVHLLLFAITLIYPLVVSFATSYPQFSVLYGFAYIFALTSLAPTIFFVMGQKQLDRPWWRLLPKILLVSVVGSGLMMNTVRAAWQIVRRPQGVFERTAKFGIRDEKQKWTHKRYQLHLDHIVYVELLMGLFNLATAWWAWSRGVWGIVFFALLFGAGLILAAGATIGQALTVRKTHRARSDHKRLEREFLQSGEASGSAF